MRVIVLGGGGMMARRAVELLTHDLAADIVVADLDIEAADEVATTYICTAAEIDVRDVDAVRTLIRGADIVLNTAGPFTSFAEPIIQAVLEERVDYCDINDDWEPTRTILERYSDVARDRRVRILLGMGASPGLTNLLARYIYECLDEVAELHTAWSVGGGDTQSGHAAMEHMLLGAANTIPVWHEDDWREIPAWRDPVTVRYPGHGEALSYPLGHPEPITLPTFLKGLRSSVNYGCVHPGGLNELTRAVADTIERGEQTAAEGVRDFYARAQREPERWLTGDRGFMGVCAFGSGTLDGSRVSITATCAAFPRGGVAGITGYPLGVAAKRILAGEIEGYGVLAPEAAFDPHDFFRDLSPTWDTPVEGPLILEEVREF